MIILRQNQLVGDLPLALLFFTSSLLELLSILILHGFDVVAHALGRVFVKLTPSDDVESLRRGVVQKIGRFFMHLEVSL